MDLDLVVKNYRVFTDARPAKFTLAPGFTAFVGLNNAGKTSILRFFYEFRPVFTTLSEHLNYIQTSLQQPAWGFGETLQDVADREEVFNNRNDRDLSFELTVRLTPEERADLDTRVEGKSVAPFQFLAPGTR